MTLRLLAYTGPDLPASYYQFIEDSLSDFGTAASIEGEIINPLMRYYILLSEQEIIGYISGQLVIDEFEIIRVFITKDKRQEGYGHHILQGVIQQLPSEVERLLLEVRESHQGARKLYQKAQFTEIGRRTDYYSKPLEDAIIMERKLS